jgi:hypothetical protein
MCVLICSLLHETQSFEALRAQKYVTSFQESGINGRCLLGITSEADAEEFGIVFRYLYIYISIIILPLSILTYMYT